MITEILIFLQIFNVRTTTTFFLIFPKNLQENRQRNYISGIFCAFKSKWQIILAATYTALFLPDSNNCFLYWNTSTSSQVSNCDNYFICKRFAVETLLWSLEFVIQINLKHDTTTVFHTCNTIYPYLFLLFSHFMFLFSPSFSYSSPHEKHSTIYNDWYNFIATCQ